MGMFRNMWLSAQGVPGTALMFEDWKRPTRFEAWPPHCVVCGRAWRPDYPEYISVMGTSYQEPSLGFLRWCAPSLGIFDVSTGVVGASIRHLCTEHSDKWNWVPDCVTGEKVQMGAPLSVVQRAWRDACYWTGSAMRLVFLLVQWCWLWLAYKTVGHRAIWVRSPWPPLRKA